MAIPRWHVRVHWTESYQTKYVRYFACFLVLCLINSLHFSNCNLHDRMCTVELVIYGAWRGGVHWCVQGVIDLLVLFSFWINIKDITFVLFCRRSPYIGFNLLKLSCEAVASLTDHLAKGWTLTSQQSGNSRDDHGDVKPDLSTNKLDHIYKQTNQGSGVIVDRKGLLIR